MELIIFFGLHCDDDMPLLLMSNDFSYVMDGLATATSSPVLCNYAMQYA